MAIARPKARRLNRYGTGGGQPVSGAEIMARHGVPSIMANNDRIDGWRRVREFLKYPPKLMIHTENCPHWWRTVPALIHDEHNGEDVDTDGEDHAGDMTRYALSTRHINAGLAGFGRHVADGEEHERKRRKAGRGRDKVVGY